MTTEKHGGESVPDASSYTMDPAEVLARAKAFDPTPISHDCGCEYCKGLPHWTGKPNREAIMRLALQMILAQCKCFTEGRAYIVDPIRRTAEQALRECGK